MTDLVCVVADRQIEAAVSGLLERPTADASSTPALRWRRKPACTAHPLTSSPHGTTKGWLW